LILPVPVFGAPTVVNFAGWRVQSHFGLRWWGSIHAVTPGRATGWNCANGEEGKARNYWPGVEGKGDEQRSGSRMLRQVWKEKRRVEFGAYAGSTGP
jgi:hypothetical protein